MASGLQGLLEQAKRAAQKRKHPLTTAHLLLTMLQEDRQTGVLLARQGVREMALIDSLSQVEEEPSNAILLAFERAQKLADALGEKTPGAIHLLLAITREPRSAGCRCLEPH